MKKKYFITSIVMGLLSANGICAQKKPYIPGFKEPSACVKKLTKLYNKANTKSRNPAAHIRKKKYLKDIDCYTIMFIESRAAEKVPPLLTELSEFISDTSGERGCSGVGTEFWLKESKRLDSMIQSLSLELHWKVKKKDYGTKKILVWPL